MASKIRLRICHHNRLFRECLASALAEDDRIDILASGDPELVAPELPCQDGLDLLLIDADLRNTTAFHLVQMFRTTGGATRIILMVPSTAPDLIQACLKAGADGCVFDDEALDEVRRAIEIVLSGRSYCSPQVAHRLFTQTDGIAPEGNGTMAGRGKGLTMREHEILGMIAYRDLGNKQIARELNLSIYTVKNHVHNIIEKLEAEDRRTAAHHAIRHGLLSESNG